MKQPKYLHLLLLPFLLSLSHSLAAQTVTWGPMLSQKARVEITSLLSVKPDAITILKAEVPRGFSRHYKNFKVQRFDSNLNPNLEAPLEPTYEGKDLSVEFALESNGSQYIFLSFKNEKLDKKFLFVQKLNATTLTLEGTLTKVSELSFVRQNRTGNFDYEVSRDSSKLLIYSNFESKKNAPEKYDLVVLDHNMQELWKKSVTLPYAENRFRVTDFTVDNDGNAYVLGIQTMDPSLQIPRDEPRYRYMILAYTEASEEVNEYLVKYNDRFITELQVDVSPKKDIVCAGFYSKKGTYSVDGSYYLRIDRETKEVVHASAKEFDIDFITMGMTTQQEKRTLRKEAKGKDQELYEYDLRDLIPRADGGAVLVAEQYFVRVHTYTNPKTGAVTTTYHYFYNTIIVVSVSPDGNIEWATKVPKFQHSVNDGGFFSSFVTMVTNDKLYFIYNDHRLNLQPQQPGKVYNFTVGDKNGIVAIAEVDTEGNVSRQELLKNTEIEAITRPKLCRQVNPSQMLLYAKRRKGIQLGLVTF